MNKTHEKKSFVIKITSPVEASLKLQDINEDHLNVNPASVATFKIYTILPKDFIAQNQEGRALIDFEIVDEKTLESKKIQTVFIAK